ncbi:hypothetical protein SSTU70S_05695 [Stutzerimonas stutzeri]
MMTTAAQCTGRQTGLAEEGHAALCDRLRALLAAVPDGALRLGRVGGDKPGILADETAVCRLREDSAGAAYGELLVEAVTALPRLLAHPPRTDLDAPVVRAAPAPHPTASTGNAGARVDRQTVEAAITTALSLQQGFPRMTISLWSRVLYSAVEPFLSASTVAPPRITTPAPAAPAPAPVADDRLDAVTQFCQFVLAQEDAESLPNAYALEQLANEWAKRDSARLRTGTGCAQTERSPHPA